MVYELIISTKEGERLLEMRFQVHFRDQGTAKLQGLYESFETAEPGEATHLLSDEEVLEAKTHEAEILNLDDLIRAFSERGKGALLGESQKSADDFLHVHRDTKGTPFVCWAGFTTELGQILTIVKAWTIFNSINATADTPVDANQVGNPFDLLEQYELQLTLDSVD